MNEKWQEQLEDTVLVVLVLICVPVIWDIWLEMHRGITLKQYIGW